MASKLSDASSASDGSRGDSGGKGHGKGDGGGHVSMTAGAGCLTNMYGPGPDGTPSLWQVTCREEREPHPNGWGWLPTVNLVGALHHHLLEAVTELEEAHLLDSASNSHVGYRMHRMCLQFARCDLGICSMTNVSAWG